MKKSLLLAVLVSACAAPPPFIPPGDWRPPGVRIQAQPPALRGAGYCHTNQCAVKVTVDANCNVSADPYVLVMNHAYGQITVQWKLSADPALHAAFKDGGIAFKTAPGQSVFQPAGNSGQVVNFQNSAAPGFYPYDVKVEVNGTACPILDPTGVNDM